MRILCTNDDGYLAIGLNTLAAAAREVGEVRVIAPDREQSATSHSLTMHHPLRVREVAPDVQHVDGTPTDCVALALGVLLDEAPDWVLSGINHGPNMGEDVLYSGTVAGAMEALILGVPAIAFSFAGRDANQIPAWGELLRRLLPQLLEHRFPREAMMNVNFPEIDPAEVRGVRVTRLARRVYTDSVTRAHDPNGREYFWIGGGGVEWTAEAGTDFDAVRDGYISVTPLHLDLTFHPLLDQLREWRLTV